MNKLRNGKKADNLTQQASGILFTKYSVVIMICTLLFFVLKVYIGVNFTQSMSFEKYLLIKYLLIGIPLLISALFVVAFENKAKKIYLIFYIPIEVGFTLIVFFS